MDDNKEWFKEWFNSKYYPILYRHRNDEEALSFVSALLKYLMPTHGTKVVDLACGRGRHSRFLHQSGLNVFGLDISEESIIEAREYETDGLRFFIHDMRDPFPIGNVDIVFNLFTSFGYFDQIEDNLKVLQNIYDSLVPGGRLVLDYFNVSKVLANLREEESQKVNSIEFYIKRYLKDGRIYKQIDIKDGEYEGSFTERVQALSKQDFEEMLSKTGFKITDPWGSYDGSVYNSDSSRLILFAEK